MKYYITDYHGDRVTTESGTRTVESLKQQARTLGSPLRINIDDLTFEAQQLFLTEFFHTGNILIVTGKVKGDPETVTIPDALLHGTVPTQEEIDAAPTTANDKQIDGDHYKQMGIQPWDYALANNLDPLQFTVVKYVTRYKTKHDDPLIDLRKTVHTLEKMIEVETAKQAAP